MARMCATARALPDASARVDAPVLAVLPTGWSVRPPRFDDDGRPDPADVDLAFDLVERAEAGLPEAGESTREEIAAMWAGPDADRDGDRLVIDADGRAAAITLLEVDPEGRTFFLDAYADWSHPGAPAGLALAAARGGLARARDVAAALGGEWTVESGSYESDRRYHEVLADLGMRPVRRFHRMRVDLAARPPVEAATAPPGVTVETADDDASRREAHRVFEASFADHWGHTPRSYAAWLASLTGLPGHSPRDWWLARVGGTPAAVCICDESRLASGDGYVRILGVLPEYRGRGIARWLLLRAMRATADRGLAGLQLGVDATNETGATQLYESVGMRATRVMTAWQLRVG